jgi:hypothetical protein
VCDGLDNDCDGEVDPAALGCPDPKQEPTDDDGLSGEVPGCGCSTAQSPWPAAGVLGGVRPAPPREGPGVVSVTLTTVLGNSQRLDGGAMFGNAPRALWERWATVDEANRIPLACRALLASPIEGTARCCSRPASARSSPRRCASATA